MQIKTKLSQIQILQIYLLKNSLRLVNTKFIRLNNNSHRFGHSNCVLAMHQNYVLAVFLMALIPGINLIYKLT